MLSLDQFMDIRFLRKQGHSIREIAQRTGHSRNTVRKLLRATSAPQPGRRARASKLAPYHDYLRERWQAYGLSAVRLHAEIAAQGFQGCVRLVRRFLEPLRRAVNVSDKLTVRFETPPGEQAQCDWAEVLRTTLPDGTPIRLYAFVMVLGYSRYLYVEFTRSMKLETLIRCHQNAFAFFGGWPKRVLYDNMKQVVVRPDRINARFHDFTRYHGFEVKRHRPYRPRTKGKVERVMDYIKDNFLKGRSFSGLEDLNARAMHWLENTANIRLHGTTKQRPLDLFPEEKLTSLESVPVYNFIDPVARTVSFESMIHFQGSRYSVPPEHAGKVVRVAAECGQIFIRSGDLIIAEHQQAGRPGQCIVDKEHLAELWKLSVKQAPLPEQRPALCRISFEQTVQQTPLALYEEAAL
jgi:transposase